MSQTPENHDEDRRPEGGQGAIADERRPKQEMATIRRAIRHDWPISDSMRKIIAHQMALIAGTSKDERNRIAASKVLVAADSVNTRREAMDQADEHKALPDLHLHGHQHEHNVTVQDLRKELLDEPDYLDHRRASETNGHAGPVCEAHHNGKVANGKPPGDPGPGTNGHSGGAE